MTRAEAVTVACRIAWPAFNLPKAEADARAIGAVKAIGRQRRFVRRVRAEFAALCRRRALMGWSFE